MQFELAYRGTLFQGSEGWVYVSRQGFFAHPEPLRRAEFGPNDIRLPSSSDHRRDFLDAVKTRRKPISPIDASVQSDVLCHQADIAVRLRRKLRWDPEKELFVGDPDANRRLTRPLRAPWRL